MERPTILLPYEPDHKLIKAPEAPAPAQEPPEAPAPAQEPPAAPIRNRVDIDYAGRLAERARRKAKVNNLIALKKSVLAAIAKGITTMSPILKAGARKTYKIGKKCLIGLGHGIKKMTTSVPLTDSEIDARAQANAIKRIRTINVNSVILSGLMLTAGAMAATSVAPIALAAYGVTNGLALLAGAGIASTIMLGTFVNQVRKLEITKVHANTGAEKLRLKNQPDQAFLERRSVRQQMRPFRAMAVGRTLKGSLIGLLAGGAVGLAVQTYVPESIGLDHNTMEPQTSLIGKTRKRIVEQSKVDAAPGSAKISVDPNTFTAIAERISKPLTNSRDPLTKAVNSALPTVNGGTPVILDLNPPLKSPDGGTLQIALAQTAPKRTSNTLLMGCKLDPQGKVIDVFAGISSNDGIVHRNLSMLTTFVPTPGTDCASNILHAQSTIKERLGLESYTVTDQFKPLAFDMTKMVSPASAFEVPARPDKAEPSSVVPKAEPPKAEPPAPTPRPQERPQSHAIGVGGKMV